VLLYRGAFIFVLLTIFGTFSYAGVSVIHPNKKNNNTKQKDQNNDPVQELIKSRKEYQEKINLINSINPLGGNVSLPDKKDSFSSQSQVTPAQSLQIYSSVIEALKQMIHHPNRVLLVCLEGGVFILFVLFRAWRLSRKSSFLSRVITSLWTGFVFFGVEVFVLPALVLGEAYLGFIQGLLQVLRSI